MWFEADPILSYFPFNDFPLREPGFEPVPLAPDARSAFPGTRAVFERDDFSGNLQFASDWSDLDGLFSPLPTMADEWGDAPTTKDGGRVMNEDGTIVVTGTRTYRLDTYSWWGTGPGADFWTVHLDGGWNGGDGAFDFVPDEAAIDVLINFDRPMTDSETQAFKDFQAAIAALTVAINALADNAEVRLRNGAYITGAALKALWAKTDFIINDNNVAYGNLSYGGEAAMINGQPTISFNISYLDRYNNSVGGINYMVAHDFAHLTQWGMPYYYDQLTANDFAREILSASGLPYLYNPDFGYSTIDPFGFSTPSGTGGDDGSGGPDGGGSGGGGGDYIP